MPDCRHDAFAVVVAAELLRSQYRVRRDRPSLRRTIGLLPLQELDELGVELRVWLTLHDHSAPELDLLDHELVNVDFAKLLVLNVVHFCRVFVLVQESLVRW